MKISANTSHGIFIQMAPWCALNGIMFYYINDMM